MLSPALIRGLQNELEDQERLVDDLKRKRDELDRQIKEAVARVETLRETIKLCGRVDDDSGSEESEVPSAPAKFVRNAAVEVLKERGELHYKTLLRLLEERDIPVNGKDRARNLNAHLSNDDRFTSLGEGVWTLSRRVQSPPSSKFVQAVVNGDGVPPDLPVPTRQETRSSSRPIRPVERAGVLRRPSSEEYDDSDLDDVPF